MPLDADSSESRYLLPGQMFWGAVNCKVKTVLGSCVAVCLYDPDKRIGGIIHYVLPNGVPPESNPERFGDLGIPQLITGLVGARVNIHALRAKIFGGASMIGSGRETESIGQKNAKIARTLLAKRSIPIVREDIGGYQARRLVFEIATGRDAVSFIG